MSVWESPCYRVEPLVHTLKLYGKKAWDMDFKSFQNESAFTVDDKAAITTDTATRVKDGTIRTTVSETFYDICSTDEKIWRKFKQDILTQKGRKPAEDSTFVYLREQLKPTKFGLQAVYEAFSSIVKHSESLREEFDKKEYASYHQDVWKLSAPASRLNRDAWESIGGAFQRTKTDAWYNARNAVEVIRHVWVLNRTASMRTKTKAFERKIYDIEKLRRLAKVNGSESKETRLRIDKLVKSCTMESLALPLSRGYEYVPFMIVRFSKGYFFYNKATKITSVLFGKDHDRLLQMLTSHSKCYAYFAMYDWNDQDMSQRMLSAYNKIILEMTFAMDRATWDSANRLCRAFDVILFSYYAELASDINNRSQVIQETKYYNENLDSVVDKRKILAIVKQQYFGVKETIELLKCYKLLPCPDFCHFSGLPDMARKNLDHRNMCNAHTINFKDNSSMTLTMDEFKLYQKRQMLVTYHARHKRLPGRVIYTPDTPDRLLNYPDIGLSEIFVSDMKYIDFKGSFKWVDFTDQEHELVKDKTTAPSNTHSREKATERIQVMKYLFDPKFLSQENAENKFYSGFVDWNKEIALAWKPEAKKPSSRLFGMATDPDRRVLSAFERNIADYLVNRPGASVGMNDQELFKKLHELYNRYEPGFEKLMVSFDLEAWSPKQSPAWKVLMLEKWAYAFGRDEFVQLEKIFSDRLLTVQKFGHTDAWKNIGVDIEGFNGKLNTDGHIDLMGYLIYKLRKASVFTEPANFMALIDDGLMEAQIPIKTYDAAVEKIITVIEEGYRMFGHAISWDKTYVSKYFSMYLNEITLEGQRITPGVKSFLKIGIPREVPIPNLIDDLTAHASTVRGAIKAGTDHNVAYDAYILEYYISLKRWSAYAKLDIRDQVLRTFLPFAYGGYALNSLFSLATNATFDSLQASIGNCKMLCLVYPSFMPYYANVFNRPVKEMDTGIILRNPTSLQSNISTIHNKVFANTVRSYILRKSVHPYIRAVACQISEETKPTFDAIIRGNVVIHNTVRDLLWTTKPSSPPGLSRFSRDLITTPLAGPSSSTTRSIGSSDLTWMVSVSMP